MSKLNKILRFRFPDEIIEELEKLPHKSQYVRQAVKEKLKKDKLLKKEKIPF